MKMQMSLMGLGHNKSGPKELVCPFSHMKMQKKITIHP
jgi:hypothetical protein